MKENIGPFYDLAHAAAYCGYSASYFSKITKKYGFKKYGPSQSRFAQADLDTFMANPTAVATAPVVELRKPIRIEV